MSFKRLLYKVFIGRGIYLLSVFLLNILFARYYGAGGSSVVYYLVNLYSLVLLIAGFSLESGMGYFLAKGEAEASALARFSVGWTLAASVLSFLLLQSWFLVFDAGIEKQLWRMSALTFIPGQLLISFFMALFYAKESATLPNMILAAVNLLLIALLPSTGLFPSVGPSGYLGLYFGSVLLQGILLALVFILKYTRNSDASKNSDVSKNSGASPDALLSAQGRILLRKLLRYSLVAFVANLAFFLVYRVDYWFVKRYCTPADLGNYIQVSKLGQMILVLPVVLASAVFPGTALGKSGNMPLFLGRMSRIAVLLFGGLFLLVMFAGKWLFPWVFGPGFDKMYAPTMLILPGILFLSLLAPLSAWFGGMKRPGVNAGSALAGLLVIIAGDWLLIPRYGITAAAAVSTAGYFTCLLWSLLAFRKESKIRLASLWIIKKEDWRWVRSRAGDHNIPK